MSDNMIVLSLIVAELGALCVYMRSIARSLKRQERALSHLDKSQMPPRRALPRASTVPDRPSLLDIKAEVDLLAYTLCEEVSEEDIVGIPTREELAAATTQDLEPDAVEHETSLFELRHGPVQADRGLTLAEMIDEELREEEEKQKASNRIDKVFVDLGNW